MKHTVVLGAIASLDLICATIGSWVGWRLFSSAQNEENVGVGLAGLVLLGMSIGIAAVGAWQIALARRPSLTGRTLVGAICVGLLPPVSFAPFGWDAYARSISSFTLACSNLHANDPSAEAAIETTFHSYFSLLHPWFAHEPDTRYILIQADGHRREFRLRCVRHGPCTVEDATPTELREAVRNMLPRCPPPPV